jgi:hypothetical protein
MDTWNREELYEEVWDRPLIKISEKYGVSAVMLGKVCRKLQIPLPGRGHWAKKEFGKAPERPPLSDAKGLPVVHRVKDPSITATSQEPQISNQTQPMNTTS